MEIKVDNLQELFLATEPLLQFLKKYYDPETIAIVSLQGVDIVRKDMGLCVINEEEVQENAIEDRVDRKDN